VRFLSVYFVPITERGRWVTSRAAGGAKAAVLDAASLHSMIAGEETGSARLASPRPWREHKTCAGPAGFGENDRNGTDRLVLEPLSLLVARSAGVGAAGSVCSGDVEVDGRRRRSKEGPCNPPEEIARLLDGDALQLHAVVIGGRGLVSETLAPRRSDPRPTCTIGTDRGGWPGQSVACPGAVAPAGVLP